MTEQQKLNIGFGFLLPLIGLTGLIGLIWDFYMLQPESRVEGNAGIVSISIYDTTTKTIESHF